MKRLTNMLVIGIAVRNFTISCIRFNWLRKFFKQRSMCIWWSTNVLNKSYKKRSHCRCNVIVLMRLLFSIRLGSISNDVACFPSGVINHSIRSVISFNDALSCNLVALYPLRTVCSTWKLCACIFCQSEGGRDAKKKMVQWWHQSNKIGEIFQEQKWEGRVKKKEQIITELTVESVRVRIFGFLSATSPASLLFS